MGWYRKYRIRIENMELCVYLCGFLVKFLLVQSEYIKIKQSNLTDSNILILVCLNCTIFSDNSYDGFLRATIFTFSNFTWSPLFWVNCVSASNYVLHWFFYVLCKTLVVFYRSIYCLCFLLCSHQSWLQLLLLSQFDLQHTQIRHF